MMILRCWSSLSRYERALILLFLLTLPLAYPSVRGDGVGYYAYVRSLLIDRDLHFENEWLAKNSPFSDANGKLTGNYTVTGNVDNHFTVGPSILWAPFLAVVHLFVLVLDQLGTSIPPDGYSWPYTATMALATAFYGFLGLYLPFRLARVYFKERWAFLAVIGIWFASSLPVYMYFNPSYSHAHSAFAVSLFLWYWYRTRERRTRAQWALLGMLSGLMLNIYYPNAIFLLVPLLEPLGSYWRAWQAQGHSWPELRRCLSANLLYAAVALITFLPTLIMRQLIYGSPLEFGYGRLADWSWTEPQLWEVLLSSNHGLLTWTPILIPALFGLLWLWKRERELVVYLTVAFLAFYYVIASYPVWHGDSSFGNRFFVSCTPLFVLGLTGSYDAIENSLTIRRRLVPLSIAGVLTSLLIVWNLGFIIQWGTNLIPDQGPIGWRKMVYNQVVIVPRKLGKVVKRYMLDRGSLIQSIEQTDKRQEDMRDMMLHCQHPPKLPGATAYSIALCPRSGFPHTSGRAYDAAAPSHMRQIVAQKRVQTPWPFVTPAGWPVPYCGRCALLSDASF